jgi:hypothetical protein
LDTTEEPGWGLFQELYYLQWRVQPFWLRNAALLEEASESLAPSVFLSAWWKALQLIAIERSVYRGEAAVLPLTLPAVRRALEREGVPLPEDLDCLEAAFYAERAGRHFETDSLREKAVRFLCEANAMTLEQYPS